MKTGFEVWAETHGTTVEEIKILLLAENHDPEQFLNGSFNTEEPLPSGRDSALSMLLERGRAGKIEVSADIIRTVLNKQIEYDMIKSDALMEILPVNITKSEATETLQEEVVLTENIVEKESKKESKAEVKTEAVRRKTKYSMNKALADDMFKFDTNMPSIRAVRMFLLSLPEYKAQDVAVMSDEEIQASFLKNYVCVSMETGVLILSKSNCDSIKDILGRNDNYFVPNT